MIMMIGIIKVSKVRVTMLPIMLLLIRLRNPTRNYQPWEMIKLSRVTLRLDDLAELGISQNVPVIPMVKPKHPQKYSETSIVYAIGKRQWVRTRLATAPAPDLISNRFLDRVMLQIHLLCDLIPI
jgi:hypothetical protein